MGPVSPKLLPQPPSQETSTNDYLGREALTMHGPATALLPGPEPSLHAHAIRLRVQPGAGGVAVIRAAGRVVDEAGARVTGAAVTVR